MYKSIAFFLFLALLFSGCYKENKDIVHKPAHLIPKDQLVDILSDMEITEGIINYTRINHPEYKSVANSYYQALFHHYHITKEQLQASLNYYNSRGDEMARVYDKVLEKLEEKQAVLEIKQKRKEEENLHHHNLLMPFPFIYKENSLSTFCYNPLL
jgi:hypothetical protein